MTDSPNIIPAANESVVSARNNGIWHLAKRTACFGGAAIVCIPMICGFLCMACQPIFIIVCSSITNGSSHDIALDINFALTCLMLSSVLFGFFYPFRSLGEACIRAASTFVLIIWWFQPVLWAAILLASMSIFAGAAMRQMIRKAKILNGGLEAKRISSTVS